MKRLTGIIIALAALLISCQEVVVLDLGETEHQLVVEAELFNPGGDLLVTLSYSQNFYDTTHFGMESEAIVSLVDSDQREFFLPQIFKGQYMASGIPVEAGDEITLKIETNGETITATTAVPEVVPIYKTTAISSPFWGSDSLNVVVSYYDIVNQDDYFRLKVHKLNYTSSSEYYLITDNYGKNGLITSPVYYKDYQEGDTVIAELYHLTHTMYKYYTGLSENTGGSFNSIAPGNPESNMPDNVLGYFTAFGYDTDTIVMSSK